MTSTNKVEDNNMTFQDLYNEFKAHNDKEMRPTTIYGYKNKEKYFECFYKIKVKNFNIMQFMEWKDDIESKPLSLRTKNDIYKFLKSILNFEIKWHEFNFIDVYNKMTKFTDPTARRKEMSYYTYEDFKKFITHAQDQKLKLLLKYSTTVD